MKTCTFNDFIKKLDPWLDDDNIYRAYIDNNGHFVIRFHDGVVNIYRIDDCEKSQLEEILVGLKEKGVRIG